MSRVDFLIRSAMETGNVVDVNGNPEQGAPLVMNKEKDCGKGGQLWHFDDKGYIRSSYSINNMVFTNTGNTDPLRMADMSDNYRGKWRYSYPDKKIYNAVGDGECLEIKGSSTAEGAILQSNRISSGRENQQWHLEIVSVKL